MDKKDNIQMRIKIGSEDLSLTVPFSQQNDVRATEKNLAATYTNWRGMFPKKSESELLAMLAYQYANYYLLLSRRYDEAMARLTKIDKMLAQTLGEQS